MNSNLKTTSCFSTSNMKEIEKMTTEETLKYLKELEIEAVAAINDAFERAVLRLKSEANSIKEKNPAKKKK